MKKTFNHSKKFLAIFFAVITTMALSYSALAAGWGPANAFWAYLDTNMSSASSQSVEGTQAVYGGYNGTPSKHRVTIRVKLQKSGTSSWKNTGEAIVLYPGSGTGEANRYTPGSDYGKRYVQIEPYGIFTSGCIAEAFIA